MEYYSLPLVQAISLQAYEHSTISNDLLNSFTYTIIIFDADISSIDSKVQHCVIVASSCCHTKWNLLC